VGNAVLPTLMSSVFDVVNGGQKSLPTLHAHQKAVPRIEMPIKKLCQIKNAHQKAVSN
jgi:hypothetical protein